mgnify:CR=1 FL=1
MTLGEIISKLSARSDDTFVIYDFANLSPSLNLDRRRIDSPRVFLGYQDRQITIGELLPYLKDKLSEYDKYTNVSIGNRFNGCQIQRINNLHPDFVIIYTKFQ